MYKLTTYCLVFLLLVAGGLCLFGLLPFNLVSLVFSIGLLLVFCLIINQLFAFFYKAPSNIESVYITALILALIIPPPNNISQMMFLAFASFFAMASKYILAINKKHLTNPAAVAVALTAVVFNQYASWWVGTWYMTPFVVMAGSLIAKKIQRWNLVISFFSAAGLLVLGHSFLAGQNVIFIAKALMVDSPFFFFGFIMLTEPATTPPTKALQRVYGALTGILYAPFVNIFGFYFSPELALTTTNIFSYIISPKEKLILTLKEKIKIATHTYDFVFSCQTKYHFKPGQYLEWTLAHQKQDNRGMRRYFTIASSPTEADIRIGVKFYDKPSSYKKALEDLTAQDSIVASQLAGDFTMPKAPSQKLVFIAGGIGVTPFRSMIKYLLDTNQKRDIVIFYANGSYDDIAYKDIFDQAEAKLGIKTIYTLSNVTGAPADFKHEEGFINQKMIEERVPDFKERMFYISGPHTMITSFEKTLKEMGIPKNCIKTDFFPGFV